MAPASFQPEDLLRVTFIVLLSAYPVAASSTSSKMLLTARRGRAIAVAFSVAAAVNVALNWVLVPLLGIDGAALATLAAYTCQALVQRVAIGNRDYPGTPGRVLATVIGVVLLAGASTLLPQDAWWNAARFTVALACLPWCWRALQRAQRTVA